MILQETAPYQEAIAWLKDLHKQTWKRVYGKWGLQTEFSERNLTSEEWVKVCELIIQYELPCEMGSSHFDATIVIHENSSIREVAPEFLLRVEESQLPIPREHALQELERYTHNTKNIRLLEWFGFPKPKEPKHYQY